jgi:hypothetical protein
MSCRQCWQASTSPPLVVALRRPPVLPNCRLFGRICMSENKGSIDLYDGGSGTDRLRLVLTGAEWAKAGVKADVASFLDDPHHVFAWHSSGLITHDFENLVLVVDGVVVDPNPSAPPNHAPVAANDMIGVNQYIPSNGENVILGGFLRGRRH